MTTEIDWTRIRESKLPQLVARWAELEKRADKLHLPRPVLEIGARGVDRRVDTFTGVTKVSPWVEVRASGEPPTFAGWAFLGTLQHVEGLVIVRAVPNADIPERYRTADPKDCDHCHARRDRLNTYVVRHDDGRVMQVGGDCAQNYLPSGDVAAILGYIVALLDAIGKIGLADPDEPGFGGLPTQSPRYDLSDILRVTLQVIRTSGWMSRTKASDGNGTATAELVSTYCDGPPRQQSEELRKWFAAVTEARRDDDVDTVAQSIAWATSNEEASDYAHNLRTIAALGFVDQKTMGIACSLVASYQRARGQIEQANRSRHVGTIGKRQEFRNLQVAAVRYFDGDYGTRAQVQFVDNDGNALVWWTSAEGGTDISALESAAGNCKRYDAKGTVKSHDTFRGVAQTILTRCALKEVAS